MTTPNTDSRAIVTLSLAGAAIAAAALPAAAQPFQQNTYSVSHTFTFQPSGGIVDVRFRDYRHAWVRTSSLGTDWDVDPAQPDPAFDPFGTDVARTPYCENSGRFGSPVDCVWRVIGVPSTGVNYAGCIDAVVPPSSARACTELDIDPFTTNPPSLLQGAFRSRGDATAARNTPVSAFAWAFSSCGISVHGGTPLGSGSIQWGLALYSDAVGGGAGASVLSDPVHFVATNTSTGLVVDAVLLDVDLDVPRSGSVAWDHAGLAVDAPEATLIVDIPPTYVAPGQEGRVELRVEHGLVAVAHDSGIFDALLPPVGTPVPFVAPLPASFTLDYNLALDPTDPWDIEVFLSGGAGTDADLPCPADLDGNGVLNIDDVDTFILFFLEGGLAADMNGDEILNVDDIDAFVTFFLGGCAGPGGEG